MCPEEEELIFTGRFSAVQLTCIGIPRRCLSKANSWALPQTDRLLGCGTWGSFKPAPEVAVLTKLRTAGPKEWCRGLGDNWLHRDILMFSFIPLMKREYAYYIKNAYYIKTEIMLTIHRSYFTDSNLSPPVASLLWQTTSSCTSPSPNIRLFHTSTLLFMLFTLRKVSSFSFWIFISFW